jgi:serine/threonine protein kinase
MTRWEQIEKICQSALELEEKQRSAFVEKACGGDEELRREVESLIKFDKRGDRFIEQPALEAAARMITQEKPESLLGQQLGSYQVQSLLGAGGMGVVYKGRDTRLNRSVAIKVLPRDKMSDPERKRRFVQEAKAASALNHPNIVTIHDIGTDNGTDFIVMEYVTGQTLDQRIPRKGMRVDDALRLAIQMADALAKAHSAGIIHRDLKPSNVAVTDDGAVKILDFGLAKLTEVSEREGEGTRTLQSETEEGTIVGTVSYMSPEQAEGKKLDARSDIFSFGSVLYEMVTGQKAFEADSKMSTVAAILKQEPKAISQLISDVPPDLEKIIARCLRKDPARRFQHMADVRVALQELKEDSDSDKLTGARSTVPLNRRPWLWTGTVMALAAMAITTWLFRGTGKKPEPAPEVIPLTTYPGWETSPSFSPDGNQVVFCWDGDKRDNKDIYVKLIGSPKPIRLTTDPAEDNSPKFSPDGRFIGFVRSSNGRNLFIVIPAIGGSERLVAELPENVHSFDWFPDGKWAVTGELTLVATESGETRSLTSSPNKSIPDSSPAASPDGRTIAFTRVKNFGVSDIYLLDLTEDLKPKGEPRRLTSLNRNTFGPTWTPDGRDIVFNSGIAATVSMMYLWRAEVSGAVEPRQLPFSAGEDYEPAVSRNGKRLAYQRVTFETNIWRLPLSGPGMAGGPAKKFIASTRQEGSAQYSPDGKRIAFASDQSGTLGIWVSDADSSNPVELISWRALNGAPRWSPDGQHIAFDSNVEGNLDIYVVRASGGKAKRLTLDKGDDYEPSWSRDGKWIYFASRRSKRLETWKVRVEGGEAVPVTRNGGGPAFEPLDGKFIYYIKGFLSGPLWKMPVDGGHEIQVLPSVAGHALCFVKEGIYFIPEPAHRNDDSSIQFLNFATGKVQKVAPVSQPDEDLSVSPDGRFLLFTQFDDSGSDLMLVENFH